MFVIRLSIFCLLSFVCNLLLLVNLLLICLFSASFCPSSVCICPTVVCLLSDSILMYTWQYTVRTSAFHLLSAVFLAYLISILWMSFCCLPSDPRICVFLSICCLFKVCLFLACLRPFSCLLILYYLYLCLYLSPVCLSICCMYVGVSPVYLLSVWVCMSVICLYAVYLSLFCMYVISDRRSFLHIFSISAICLFIYPQLHFYRLSVGCILVVCMLYLFCLLSEYYPLI